MGNTLNGIATATNRNGTINATTINGYRINLSADAYDAVAAVGSDAAEDIRACVARLSDQPITDVDAVRDWFTSECLDGVEGDLIAAWTEYANEIVSVAAEQLPDQSAQRAL